MPKTRFHITGIRRIPSAAGLIIFACLLLLTGCGGSNPALPQGDFGEDQLCVWLLWLKDQRMLDRAEQGMFKGGHFLVVAHELARKYPKRALLHGQCAEDSKLDPDIVAKVEDLELGEVSAPFPFNEGSAMVMRTTDHFRKQGQEMFKQRLYRQAEGQLRQDLALHPTSAASWHLLARCRAALGDMTDAIAAFGQAAKYDPKNPVHYYYKGLAHEELGQSKEAMLEFRRAANMDPQNPVLAVNLARSLADNGQDLKQAESLAAKAVEIEPENAEAWHALGKVRRALGHQVQAAIALHKALTLRPQDPVIRQDFLDAMLAVDNGQMHNLVAKRSAPPAKAAPKKPKKDEPTDLIPRVAEGGGDQEPRAAKPSGKKNGRAAKKRRASRPIQEVSPLPTPAALLPEVVKDMTKPERFEAESKAKAKPKPEPAPSEKTRPEEPEDALLPSAPSHYLQVGNFQDENLARAILLKWQAMKINGHIESFRLPGGPKEFLVLLGPYPSRDAARKEGLRLRRMNAVEFFMVVERETKKKDGE